VTFKKPPLSLSDQVQRLVTRGLIVPDPTQAEHSISSIGYYRFSAYALPFQQLNGATLNGLDKPFAEDTSFNDILNVYEFDRNLRLHLLDAIERIEVSFRTSLVHKVSLQHGSHWYLDSSLFNTRFDHAKFISKIKYEFRPKRDSSGNNYRHGETFIQHYFDKYTDPDLPPVWMICEILTLGTWSQVYKNLDSRQLKKEIAQDFGVAAIILEKWIHTLSNLRNLCAHHCRLWNRKFVMKPIIANKHSTFLSSNDYLYAQVVVLFEILNQSHPNNSWASQLHSILDDYPTVNLQSMGFPEDWAEEPFWEIT